jgi:acetyl-CoA carboxylase biotin carboxyl carrier protein
MSDEPLDFNLQELKELIKLLRESGIAEFELRKADYRLRIRQGVVVEDSLTPRPAPVNGEQALSAAELAAGKREQTIAEEEKEELHEIRSPIVGTFYRSSSPGSASFVEPGDVVKKGQVLCIIEAMKIMNEIESDVNGEVREIYVENGQPVEFGELLFTVKPVA